MATKKKEKQFAKFIMHNVPNAPFFFTGYSVDGNLVYLKNGVNAKTGEDEKAKIMFPKGKRIITIPMGKKDVNGQSFVEFIRNSPYCKGSETCDGDGLFYEFNPARDSKVAVDEERIMLKAASHAMTVEGDELIALAAMVGVVNEENEDIMRNAVLQYAKMKPREFNEISNAPDLSIQALAESCISLGIIKKRGYAFDLDVNGNTSYLAKNKTELVAKIRSDEKLLAPLKENVQLAKDKG